MRFDYNLDYKKINFRDQPELYGVGIGEQGVLLVEPYKSEILPYWRFKTAEIAAASAKSIYQLFKDYKRSNDFVGMDMSRKFLQMGFTRARRYANHPSGKKYSSNPQKARTSTEQSKLRKDILPQDTNWATSEKAKAAKIFYEYYLRVKEDRKYQALKEKHLLMTQTR